MQSDFNMIKSSIVLFITFLTTLLIAQESNTLDIQFKTNEFYSQYLFAQSLAGAPGTTPSLKMYFEQSAYASDKQAIKAIEKLERINVYYEYDFEGYPPHRSNGIQLWQLLKIAAANSSDVESFSSRIVGMLPIHDMLDLIESLDIIEEIHRELIWLPNKEKIQDYLVKLRNHASKGDFKNKFSKAASFYGSTWNSKIPYQVYILPVEEVNGSVYEIATPEGNILSYSIKIRDEPTLSVDLGVIYHELCHILYKNQPKKLQQDQENMFLKHGSAYKVLAYQVLDEALATALGQGWYYKQLEGFMNEEDWYAVSQINDVSKAIYSLVESYIHSGRLMDEQFVDQYLKLYEEKFEADLYEVESNISHVNLIMDVPYSDPNEIFPNFFQHFNMRSIEEFYGIQSQNIEDWSCTLGTKMVLVNSKSNTYDLLQSSISWLPDFVGRDMVVSKINEGEHYYIVVVSEVAKINRAFQLISEKGKIGNEVEILLIE